MFLGKELPVAEIDERTPRTSLSMVVKRKILS
jgi:hypothetical protein